VSYYRGDGGGNYYRGDYYRGDPFLGGLIAGAVGKLAGKAAGWVGRQVSGRAGRVAGAIVRDAAPGVVGGVAGYAAGRRSMPQLPALGPMTGLGPDITFKQRRRINPLNPKALRRALRRAEGFEKFAARTVNSLYRVIDGRKVRTFKKRTRSS